MFQVSLLKKARTYFNQFVPQVKREKYHIKIEVTDNTLILTLQDGELGMRCLVPTIEIVQDFNPIHITYLEFFNAIDELKGLKTSDMIPINGNMNVLYFGTLVITGELAVKASPDWCSFVTIASETLNDSIMINNICAKNGLLNCNSNIIFRVYPDEMIILNTNDIMLQENKIECEGNDLLFGFKHFHVSTLKKWLSIADKEGDTVELFKFNMSHIKFKALADTGINYELIIPITINEEINNIFTNLSSMINFNFEKSLINFDTNEMKNFILTEKTRISQLKKEKDSKSKAKKDENKDESDEYDKKRAKVMNTNKEFEDYLDLSDILHIPNLFVLRTMFADFFSNMDNFEFNSYVITNLPSQTLLFEYEDEYRASKTLIMTKQPVALLQIEEEDINDESLEEKLDEDDSLINDDDLIYNNVIDD